MISLLRAHGISPRKSLGQNFLIDDAMAQRIVAAARIAPQDTVIEIGSGIGALTKHLARRARQVIAIELDQHLIPLLREELQGLANIEIIHADALEVNFAQLVHNWTRGVTQEVVSRVHIVANLPYYITSAVIRRLLESELRFASIVLTIQLEVAQRIVAGPGEMSLLAVSVQFYGKPELLWRIPPSMFYPQPDVDSAVIRITPSPEPPVDRELFFRWVKAGFSQPRKQLRNTLSSGLGMSKAQVENILLRSGIDPGRRAESLGMEDWVRLVSSPGQLGREDDTIAQA